MSKPLSVKIKKDKVLKALRTSLSKRMTWKDDYAKERAKYEKAQKAWENAVIKKVGKNTKPSEISVRVWGDKVRVQYEFNLKLKAFPDEPQAPETKNDWQVRQEIEEIENAIRMLEMSDDEIINTSTYRSIAGYL